MRGAPPARRWTLVTWVAARFACSPHVIGGQWPTAHSACSFQLVLGRLHEFVTTSILETRVAGRNVANFISAVAKANPRATLGRFMPGIVASIGALVRPAEDAHAFAEHNEELNWNLIVFSEASPPQPLPVCVSLFCPAP